MAMLKSWEEGRAEARTQGRAEGRTEGRAEGEANALLTVLQARNIAMSDAVRERILAQKDQEQLKRWLERAAVASSIAEVLDDAK